MKNIIEVDGRVKTKKPEELVDLPVVVRINKIDAEESFKVFSEEFNKACNNLQPVIPIIVESYGGAVDTAIAMGDLIRTASKPVATIVEGKAMSAEAFLFTFGANGHQYMGPNARLMIHEVASWVQGKVNEIKADAAETDRLNTLVLAIMAKNCGKPADYFLKLIHEKNHADWYLTPAEAKRHNLTKSRRCGSRYQ